MTRKEAAQIGNKLIKESNVRMTQRSKLTYINNIYYWANRKEQDEIKSNRSATSVNKELEGYYKEASKAIQNELKATYQDYLQEDVSLDNMKKYLTSDELNNFKISLKNYYNKVDELGLTNYRDYLKKLSTQAKISRLDMLETNIEAEIKVLQGKERELVTRELNRVAEVSLDNNGKEIKERFGTTVSFETPSDQMARKVVNTSFKGHNYAYRLGVNNDNLASTIKSILPQAFIMGKSSSTLAKELDYRTNVGLHNAQRIVRTETNRCFNKATMESYKEANVTEQYQYLATEDERTCDICGGFHEKIFNVKDAEQGLNYPSMHPNCRCTTIPYFPPDEFDISMAPMKPDDLRKWAQELSPQMKKELGIVRIFDEAKRREEILRKEGRPDQPIDYYELAEKGFNLDTLPLGELTFESYDDYEAYMDLLVMHYNTVNTDPSMLGDLSPDFTKDLGKLVDRLWEYAADFEDARNFKFNTKMNISDYLPKKAEPQQVESKETVKKVTDPETYKKNKELFDNYNLGRKEVADYEKYIEKTRKAGGTVDKSDYDKLSELRTKSRENEKKLRSTKMDITEFMDFKDVKDLKDLKANFKTLFGSEMSPKFDENINLETAKGLFGACKKMVAEYPTLYNNLNKFQYVEDKKEQKNGTLGYFNKFKNQLWISTEYKSIQE